VWNNVMRSAVYERVPAPVFPVGRVFEDVSVVSSLLARCESLARLARPIIDYRQHAASLKMATSAKWCVDFAQALGQVKAGLAGLPVSDKVHACTSKRLFLDSLFHPVGQVLAAMRGGLEYSHDRRFDASVATQVRSALSGNLAFTLAKTASQRLKMWRQRRLAAG
jgi:hypothetical protein